jgi:hypothetical protein
MLQSLTPCVLHRFNLLTSIQDVVGELTKCCALQVLHLQVGVCSGRQLHVLLYVDGEGVHAVPSPFLILQNCTGKTDSSAPTGYCDGVFRRLRGLQECDGVPMPGAYALTTPDHRAALEFLCKVWRVDGAFGPGTWMYI